MKVYSNVVVLASNERRYQGQYRIPVSMLATPYKSGTLVKTEIYGIPGGEGVVVCFSQVERMEPGVHRVTKSKTLTFTPPKGLVPDQDGKRKSKYKTYTVQELFPADN